MNTGNRPRASMRVASYSNEHFEQVCALYGEVFGTPAAEAFRTRWNWSQEDNVFPEQTRRWVLLAGEKVTGFLGAIPLPYRVNGRDVVAHTPCDYMVHPDYRFHGIKLMRQCFKECENCVSADDIAATIKVTKWLGAEEAGEMWRYARVVNAHALRRGRMARVPGPLWTPVDYGLRAYQALRLAKPDSKYRVEQADGFDNRFDRFSERLSAAAPASLVRDSRFLNWRYGQKSPHANSQIATVSRSDGELAGYVVYYMSQGPGRYGYIFDLQAQGDDAQQVAARLLSHGVTQLRKAGAWVVQYYQASSTHALPESLLVSYGFVQRVRHMLLVRLAEPGAQAAASESGNWRYVYGDSEASHSVI